jgi:hypothetical protein
MESGFGKTANKRLTSGDRELESGKRKRTSRLQLTEVRPSQTRGGFLPRFRRTQQRPNPKDNMTMRFTHHASASELSGSENARPSIARKATCTAPPCQLAGPP